MLKIKKNNLRKYNQFAFAFSTISCAIFQSFKILRSVNSEAIARAKNSDTNLFARHPHYFSAVINKSICYEKTL